MVYKMKNFVDFHDKTILVTGGSSGIGKATAIMLSELGAKVVIVARDEEKLKNTISELKGEGHSYYSYDLRQFEGIEELVKKIVKENGKINGFVHSAGVHGTRPLKLMSLEHLQSVMGVNVLAFVEIVRCITKKPNCGEGLSIIGVSSIGAVQGNRGKLADCVSKGGMDSAIRSMAMELGKKKIRVNSVLPGLVETPMLDDLLSGASGVSEAFDEAIRKQYLGLIPAEQVANLLVFLLSDAASYITGCAYLIDGGACN